jgi:hypothetical protein
MTTAFSGFDGVINFTDADNSLSATVIGNLRNFSIETSQDSIETTSMEDSGHRTFKAGLSSFTFSGDVFFDYTDAVQLKMEQLTSKDDTTTGNDAVATFEAYPSGTTSGNAKYSGSCIITSFSVTSSVDGVVEASFSAQGTGPLAVDAA